VCIAAGLCSTPLTSCPPHPTPRRPPTAPFRMPIVDKYKDMGTMIMGKSEAGLVAVGDVLQVMPNKLRVKVEAVYRDEQESFAAKVCGVGG